MSRALKYLENQCGYQRLIRDHFIAGLQSTKQITAFITECERKTFADTIHERGRYHPRMFLWKSKLEQISSHQGPVSTQRVTEGHTEKTTSHRKNRGIYVCVRCTSKEKHRTKDFVALKLKCNKFWKLELFLQTSK